MTYETGIASNTYESPAAAYYAGVKAAASQFGVLSMRYPHGATLWHLDSNDLRAGRLSCTFEYRSSNIHGRHDILYICYWRGDPELRVYYHEEWLPTRGEYSDGDDANLNLFQSNLSTVVSYLDTRP